MTKKELIKTIQEFDANLIWELDNPLYYPFIGWNGMGTDSYWLDYNLTDSTVNILTQLLKDLKNIK